MTQPDPATTRVIEQAYEAFERRDVDAAVALMTGDVAWANGWEGGHVHGRAGVRDYWRRQWAELDPHVTPVAMAVAGDDRVVVEVDQEVHDVAGELLSSGRVRHVYTFRDGLVCRFDIGAEGIAGG